MKRQQTVCGYGNMYVRIDFFLIENVQSYFMKRIKGISKTVDDKTYGALPEY